MSLHGDVIDTKYVVKDLYNSVAVLNIKIDKLFSQRSMIKKLEDDLDIANDLINSLYESGDLSQQRLDMVREYLHGS